MIYKELTASLIHTKKTLKALPLRYRKRESEREKEREREVGEVGGREG